MQNQVNAGRGSRKVYSAASSSTPSSQNSNGTTPLASPLETTGRPRPRGQPPRVRHNHGDDSSDEYESPREQYFSGNEDSSPVVGRSGVKEHNSEGRPASRSPVPPP